MIQLITIGLTVVVGIISIIKWLGSYKRKREARRMQIERQIKSEEHKLSNAMHSNDTVSISVIVERLRLLRAEYSNLNEQG